jgi:transposase-like protein
VGAERQTSVELARKLETRRRFSPESKREFVEKIVVMDKTLGGLAEELGIPPEVMRSWSQMVARSAMTLVPTSRILELEHDIEELKRQIDHQAITIRILENK